MKILVFSDTHGRTGGMLRAIAAHNPDTVLHLGDCAEDMRRVEKDYPMLPILKVCGNCDDYPHEQETREVSLGGMKLYMAHGHRHRVKWELEPLLLAGQCAGAQMVLFGHTHRAVWETFGGMYVLNPGTAGIGPNKTFALLEIENGDVKRCEILPIPEKEPKQS